MWLYLPLVWLFLPWLFLPTTVETGLFERLTSIATNFKYNLDLNDPKSILSLILFGFDNLYDLPNIANEMLFGATKRYLIQSRRFSENYDV